MSAPEVDSGCGREKTEGRILSIRPFVFCTGARLLHAVLADGRFEEPGSIKPFEP
jgi:hypothetical protein